MVARKRNASTRRSRTSEFSLSLAAAATVVVVVVVYFIYTYKHLFGSAIQISIQMLIDQKSDPIWWAIGLTLQRRVTVIVSSLFFLD